MRNRSVKHAIQTIKQTHKASPFSVSGFCFILDTQDSPPLIQEDYQEGMPRVPGFIFVHGDCLGPDEVIDVEVV